MAPCFIHIEINEKIQGIEGMQLLVAVHGPDMKEEVILFS